MIGSDMKHFANACIEARDSDETAACVFHKSEITGGCEITQVDFPLSGRQLRNYRWNDSPSGLSRTVRIERSRYHHWELE